MPRYLPLVPVLSLLLTACEDPDAFVDDERAPLAADPLEGSDEPEEPLFHGPPTHAGHREHMAPVGPLSGAVGGSKAPNDNCTQVHANALDAVMVDCGNNYYDMTAGAAIGANHGICYWPRPVASSFTNQRGMVNTAAWLAGNVQATPIYKPFRATDVGITNGWMYDATAKHCGLDYARNGTFEVRAVADGVVVFVGYMPSPGNVVIIEHTLPDGSRYRTIHHHLRDGRDVDIARGRLTLAHSNLHGWGWHNEPYKVQYQNDADLAGDTLDGNPTAAQIQQIEARWGTNGQTLSVAVGDVVKAGEFIGWAGMTGFDQTGIHLHIMFARQATVRAPQPNGTLLAMQRWIFFDPYGLYAGPSNECYQGFAPTGAGGTNRHASVLSPVPAEFPLTASANFQTILDYFASKGLAPRSLATDSTGGVWRVAGAFAPRSVIPVTRVLSTFTQHQSDYDTWGPLGWIPDQVVGMTTTGGARYSSIFAPAVAGTTQSHMMSPGWFGQRFNDLYNTHRLTDVSLFNESGALYLSGIWKPQAGGGYAMYYAKTRAEFDALDDSMVDGGLAAVQVVKYNHPGLGDRYAGLWHTLQNEAVYGPFVDLTADQLASYRDLYIGWLGLKVKHLSAYKGLYSVIFTNK